MTWRGLNPPYATIVADPPWQYGKRIVSKDAKWAENNYRTLPMDEIAKLPVAELAAERAHLYIWTTAPRLFGDRSGPSDRIGPVDILRAWGFDYTTTLVWKKPAGGMGNYFRVDAEFVLFGVRGCLPIPPAKRESSVFAAPKHGHSVKPQTFMDMVERVSPGPYLELFARQPRLGWDHWGLGFEEKTHENTPENLTGSKWLKSGS